MSPTTSTLFPLFFTLSLILITSYAAPPQKNYVAVCKGDTHCLKVLGSNPNIVAAKDWVTLSRLVLQMAIQHGVKAQNYVKGLISKYPSSKAIKLCAAQDYDYSIGSFRSSLVELNVDRMSANYDARVAADGPNSCQDGLAKEKLVIPAVDGLNQEIIFFSNVAYDATSHLL